MRSPSARYLAAFWFAFALVVLLVPAALLGQDTTVVVDDKTGLFGPVIDRFWPVVVTFLISLTVKLMTKISDGFRSTSEPVKWVALYAWSLVYNLIATALGIETVDPLSAEWGSAFALGAVQTAAAAIVYKFGGHNVPAVEPDVRSPSGAQPFTR